MIKSKPFIDKKVSIELERIMKWSSIANTKEMIFETWNKYNKINFLIFIKSKYWKIILKNLLKQIIQN